MPEDSGGQATSYHGRLGHEQEALTQLAQPSLGLAPSQISCRKTGQHFAVGKAFLPQNCRKKGLIRGYGLIRRLKTANNILQKSVLLRM
ncbi:hypothetical protein [Ruegeria profundi]|uniref:hypothetical protein n=1 Tax=Ruegeria profundi TaxID=1685378 RepID=UPI003C7C54C9